MIIIADLLGCLCTPMLEMHCRQCVPFVSCQMSQESMVPNASVPSSAFLAS